VRTAVCAAADGLVIPKRNAASMTAAAVKASAGAAAKARIARVTNLIQALEQIKERGLWCVAVEARGEKDIRELDKTMDYCLVLGGEAQGIRRLLRKHCDLSARIPMPGPLDSLNVSVAAGVVLFSLLPEKG
jgi:23S rRNA (guanosine2251-2'-O)-methyltransferase